MILMTKLEYKKWIILVDFIDVLTPANHLQT